MRKHASTRHGVPGLLANRGKLIFDENVRKERIVPLIASLKSMNVNERTGALSAIAELISDINLRHMLLRERLIKVIMSSILSDSSLEIVAQGLGVLRNIVLLEGRDPALFLVREHIKTPLASLSSKAFLFVKDASSELDGEQKKILDLIFENSFGLVSATLIFVGEIRGFEETLQLGVELIRSAGTEEFRASPRSLEAAFEMLYYVTESSVDVLSCLCSLDEIKQFKQIAIDSTSSTWSTKVYGIGIDCNVIILNGEGSKNIQACATELTSFLNSVPRTEKNGIQICLELISLFAQSEDLEIITLLISQVGTLILDQLVLSPDFQLQCVSVLNNIGWSLNALSQDWKTDATKIYTTAIHNCFKQLDDIELVSSALGLINSTLIQEPNLIANSEFKELYHSLLVKADQLYQAKDAGWIALGRVVVLTFGSKMGPSTLWEMIDSTVKMLLCLLEHSNDVEAQVDALDALFGIFGDNDSSYNQSEYVDKGLHEKLERLKPSLKRSLKSPPKTSPELRKQGLDALQNYELFLIYKRG